MISDFLASLDFAIAGNRREHERPDEPPDVTSAAHWSAALAIAVVWLVLILCAAGHGIG